MVTIIVIVVVDCNSDNIHFIHELVNRCIVVIVVVVVVIVVIVIVTYIVVILILCMVFGV